MSAVALEIRDLSIWYAGAAPAVLNIDLAVQRGEILGIIGESGSGKTSLAHAVLGLLPASATMRGARLALAGTELISASPAALRAMRGPGAAMIFQNPGAAFSPLHTVGEHFAAFLWRDRRMSGHDRRARIVAALRDVGIADPAARLSAHPFQLSGGMLQRVAIAAALLMRPALLIADEPTTALDVTMEAQILHLLRGIRENAGVAILLISHQLGVIAEICDRVAVMYAGRIVEEGPVAAIFARPRHPYTQALFACEPSLIKAGALRLPVIAGVVPRPGGAGCGFASRCVHADAQCRAVPPPWQADADHRYCCHRIAA